MSDGWSTDYYQLPEGAKEMQDLIEHRDMNFAIGNIFKACYRYGHKENTSREYDLRKIRWYAERELQRLELETWVQENSPKRTTTSTTEPQKQRSSGQLEIKLGDRPRQLELFPKGMEKRSTTRSL